MSTFPLPTLGPTISSTGISIPQYSDIYTSLQASFKSIYGSDAYIAPDSQDGQLLAVFAQAISDCNQAAVAVYNQFSPTTSQGAGLSSVVQINGLQREVASNSTVNVTIGGVVGTTITNGIVGDTSGNQWNLPASVLIPVSGSVVVTATAVTVGALTAAISTVTSIITPTLGWQTVVNNSAAVTGAPVETDSSLRQRQVVSTELPSQSIIGGIYGAVANLAGVTQLKVFENDTGGADSNGLPAHSISVVVQGGDAATIAQTIEKKKTPGTATYGSTSEVVTDPVGVPVTINFYVPTQDIINVALTVKGLSGYVSTTGTQIKASIASVINGLGINANAGLLNLSLLTAAAYQTSAPSTYNVTIMTAAISPAAVSNNDLTIAFNALPITGTVTLTVT